MSADHEAAEAIKGLARAITKLKDLGVIRSRRFTGDLGEWYVATLWDGEAAESQTEKAWDIRLPSKERAQVKTQTYDQGNRWNYLDSDPDLFDRLIAVILNEDFTIRDLYDVPASDLKSVLRVGKEGRPCYYWDDLKRWRVDPSTLPGFGQVAGLIQSP